MKKKALRNHGLYEKLAASALLKLKIKDTFVTLSSSSSVNIHFS